MSQENGNTPEPPAFAPGMNITGGTATFNITAARSEGGEVFVLFHVEHQTGSTVLPIVPAFARHLAGMLLEAAGKADEVSPPGLVIPQLHVPPDLLGPNGR